jgi:hypothetical protein
VSEPAERESDAGAAAFEAELRGITPREPSAELEAAVAARVGAMWPAVPARRMPWADRVLAATVMTGAAAACVVVAMLATDGAGRAAAPGAGPAAGDVVPTPAEARRRLAQLAESLDRPF